MKTFTEDEIRTACNDHDPREAIVIALSIFQRAAIALERIAEYTKPEIVLEERAHGSGDSQHGRTGTIDGGQA